MNNPESYAVYKIGKRYYYECNGLYHRRVNKLGYFDSKSCDKTECQQQEGGSK